jgi:glycosyltransferase involved in cell wall biosynthesis
MKVLFISTNFPRWSGDSRGPFQLLQSKALHDLGAEVTVITLHGAGTKSSEIMEGVKVIRPRYMYPQKLEFLQDVGGGLPAVWERQPLARLIFIPLFISTMIAIMRYGRQNDVVHAHWSLPAAAAVLTSWYHQRPIVVTLHGSDTFYLGRSVIGRLFNRLFISRCNRVLVISQSLANSITAQGVPSELVRILPEGINIGQFKPPEGDHEPFVLFCGSLIPRKGVNFLLNAMVTVFAQYPNYRLVVIGPGPEQDNLKRQAQDLCISDKVVFIGPQSPQEVQTWMQRAKVFVLPSLEEGQGIVILEAQASGTPVVASQVGGIPEWISNETGILVPPADPQALARAIITLLDEKVWKQYSQNCRPWAESRFYSWEKVASTLMDIFIELPGRNPK